MSTISFDTLVLDVRSVGLHDGRHLGPGAYNLAHVLSRDYSRNVEVLDPARWGDRHRLLTFLGDWSRILDRTVPGRNRLLVLSTTCTRFVRQHDTFEAVALSSSVPGRPSTMLRIDEVFAALTSTDGGTRTAVVLEVDVVSSRRGDPPINPRDAAEAILDEARKRSIDLLLFATAGTTTPTPMIDYRPQMTALIRSLKAAAHRAESVTVTSLHSELMRIRDELDDAALVLRATDESRPARFAPVHTEPTFPDYIIDDLFAVGAGSRLDAIVELADIIAGRSMEASPETARRALDELVTADPDMQVRAEAMRTLTTQASLTMRDMEELEICHPGVTDAMSSSPDPEFVSIPAGLHTIGVDEPHGQWFERPRFTVSLSAFRMARQPVTVAQYYRFLQETGWPVPPDWTSDAVLLRRRRHPVGYVSFYDACAYCEWLTERLHSSLATGEKVELPTELQWEAAARWPHGQAHPWGSNFDPTRCNTFSRGSGEVTESGLFSPRGDTPTGLIDIIGNVWEWTQSAWGVSGRAPASLYPLTPEQDALAARVSGNVRRIVRGAAYYYSDDCSNAFTRNRAFPEDVHRAGSFRPVIRSVGTDATGESR